MNKIAFTIANNEFNYKTQLPQQQTNKFHWTNPETKGCIHSGSLLSGYSYSVIDFQACENLELEYATENADGYVFIINNLTSSKSVQLATENNVETEYFPKANELYILPAGKSFSITFAAATAGKTTLFFISNEVLKGIISPALAAMLEQKSFLPFSELINECVFKELCKQSNSFYRYNTAMINTDIIFSLLAILKNYNDFDTKNLPLNLYPHHYAVMNSERYAEPYKKAA